MIGRRAIAMGTTGRVGDRMGMRGGDTKAAMRKMKN
jgi:hypothetical protein